MNRKISILRIALLFVSMFAGFHYWNDHRERSFTDLVSYPSNDFLSIGFRLNKPPDHGVSEWVSSEAEAATELMQFLGQYRLQKIGEADFRQSVGNRLFEFTISSSYSNPVIVHASENFVHILAGHYYKVVNGPIDVGWINQFNEKHQSKKPVNSKKRFTGSYQKSPSIRLSAPMAAEMMEGGLA